MGECSSLDKEKGFVFLEEILAEILSWLEAKYLLRCECVCKVWCAVIRSKLLVDMHALRNHRIQEKLDFESKYCRGLLLEQHVSVSPFPPSAIAYYRIRNPANYLIAHPPTYLIRNPTTKRILNLPCPRKQVVYMHIFQYPSTGSYYVVSVLYNRAKQKYDLALLDLGGQSDDPCPNADLSWRIVKSRVFGILSRQDIQERCHFSYCVSREGILHILTSPRVGLQNPKVICVDLVKKTCGILKVPQNLYFNCKELKFQSWTNKPSIVFVRDQKLNIWVLEDYKKQKWADTIVVPLPFLEQHPSLMTEVPHIHRDNDDEEDILVYIPGPGNPHHYTVKSGSVCSGPRPLMRIPATLVSLRGMQPEKKDC